MNINLREEETTAYIDFYQQFLEDVQHINKDVNDMLNEILLESKYNLLQKLIVERIDKYTEILLNDVENGVFANWIESNSSLRACLRTYQAGEDADIVCAQIEQNMSDMMISTLKIEKADAIITERPIVSEDGLEQLEDICRSARTEIQDIKSQYIAQVKSKYDENEIYGTLRPLFEGTATSIDSFLEASQNSFEKLHEFVKSVATIIRNNAEENSSGSNIDSTGTTSEPTSGSTGESTTGTEGKSETGNDSNQVEPEGEHGDREEGAEPQKEEKTEENSDKKKKNNWLKVAKDLFLKFGPPTMRVIASGLPDIVNADPVLAISPFGRASEGIAKMLNTLADEIDKGKGDNKDDKSDAPDTDNEKKNAAIQLAMGALNAMGIPTDIKDDKETESFMKDHKQEMTEGLLGWLLGDDPDMVRLFGVLGYDIGEIKKDAQEDKKDGSTGDTITMDYPVKFPEGDKNVSKVNDIKQENNGKGNVPGGTDRRAYIDTISDVTSMLGDRSRFGKCNM